MITPRPLGHGGSSQVRHPLSVIYTFNLLPPGKIPESSIVWRAHERARGPTVLAERRRASRRCGRLPQGGDSFPPPSSRKFGDLMVSFRAALFFNFAPSRYRIGSLTSRASARYGVCPALFRGRHCELNKDTVLLRERK